MVSLLFAKLGLLTQTKSVQVPTPSSRIWVLKEAQNYSQAVLALKLKFLFTESIHWLQPVNAIYIQCRSSSISMLFCSAPGLAKVHDTVVLFRDSRKEWFPEIKIGPPEFCHPQPESVVVLVPRANVQDTLSWVLCPPRVLRATRPWHWLSWGESVRL